MAEKLKLEIDELKLYFGYDYHVGNITIHQPIMGEIIDYGEREYYSMVHCLTSIPSDAKQLLWESGIDYCKISDFEYFIHMTRNLSQEQTAILLGDLDLSKMNVYKKDEDLFLVDEERGLIIDKMVQLNISTYLRMLHNIKTKPEKTKSKIIRDILIEEDKRKRELHKDDEYQSALLPMFSVLVTSGIYRKDELKQVGLYEFFNTVNRLPMLKTAAAVMNGLYCGFADYSKNRAILDQANIYRDIPKN